jgi:hypothetical protein
MMPMVGYLKQEEKEKKRTEEHNLYLITFWFFSTKQNLACH